MNSETEEILVDQTRALEVNLFNNSKKNEYIINGLRLNLKISFAIELQHFRIIFIMWMIVGPIQRLTMSAVSTPRNIKKKTNFASAFFLYIFILIFNTSLPYETIHCIDNLAKITKDNFHPYCQSTLRNL